MPSDPQNEGGDPEETQQREDDGEQGDESESGFEEEEEEEDDDGEDDDQDNGIAEESPRGRFKRFQEELGRGAYKIVYKGVDHETGLEVAWNSISLTKLPQSDWARIKKEIDLIKSLAHVNIIHFITGWQNKKKNEVVFITEITSGTLRRYIKKNKITKLRVIKGWCQSILSGLVYLHEQQLPIIHRDLKCDNIFINSNSGEIRIGDLGLSTPMNNSYTSSVLGTPEFMAPELYEEHYDCMIDIYAFGMCMLEMITQELPYQECSTPAQIYKKVTAQQPPMALSRILDSEVHSFIAQCLHPDKSQRPNARWLLESDFIQKLDDEKSKESVPLGPGTRRPAFKRRSFLANVKSVIPEEEEETSDRDEPTPMSTPAQTQLQQLPPPMGHEGYQIQPNAQQTQQHQSELLKTNSQQQNHVNQSQSARDYEAGQTLSAGKYESMIREMNAAEFHEEEAKGEPQQLQKQSSSPASPLIKPRESVNSSSTEAAKALSGLNTAPQLIKQPSSSNESDGFMRSNTDLMKAERNIEEHKYGRQMTEDFQPRPAVLISVKDEDKRSFNGEEYRQAGSPILSKSTSHDQPQQVALMKSASDTLKKVNSAALAANQHLEKIAVTTTPQDQKLQNKHYLHLQQANSDGNQSQSSSNTLRKLTDVGNPDCTFSDPKFVQENEDINSSGRDSIPVTTHPFAGIAAQDGAEVEAVDVSRNRKYTQEAHFGGSDSEKEGYTDEEHDAQAKVGLMHSGTDDDEESMHQKMNESVNFLNDFDKKKHLRSNMQDYAETNVKEGPVQNHQAQGDNNLLDAFKEHLQKQDQIEQYQQQQQQRQHSPQTQQPVQEKKKVGSGAVALNKKQQQPVKPSANLKQSPNSQQQQQYQQQLLQQQSQPSSTQESSTSPRPVASQEPTQQAITMIKQSSEQKVQRSSLVFGKKFEEDDIEKGGAHLLLDQNNGGVANQKGLLKQKTVQQQYHGNQDQPQSKRLEHAPAIEQIQQQQQQQQQQQMMAQKRGNGNQKALILQQQQQRSDQQKPGPVSVLTTRTAVVAKPLLEDDVIGNVANQNNNGDESEFDEQRTSSDSDDSNLSDMDISTSNVLRTAPPAQAQQQHNKQSAGVQQKPAGLHPSNVINQSASNSQRHLVPAPPQKLSQTSKSFSINDHSSRPQYHNRDPNASQPSQSKQLKNSKSFKGTARPKDAGLAPFVQPQNDRQAPPNLTAPNSSGDDWKIVTQSSRGQQHLQQVQVVQTIVDTGRAEATVVKPTTKKAKDKIQTVVNNNFYQSQAPIGVKAAPETTNPHKANEKEVAKRSKVDRTRSSSNVRAFRQGGEPPNQPQQQQQAKPPRKVGDHSATVGAQQQKLLTPEFANEAAMHQQSQLQQQQQAQQPTVPDNCVHSHWKHQTKNVINITIQYPVLKDKNLHKTSKTSFDFTIGKDTETGVANEMVSMLKVNPGFTTQIKNEIAKSVHEHKANLHMKRSFRNLQSHLEVFFGEMKQQGITSQKEICRIFDNMYPTGQTEDHAKAGCYFEGMSKINKIIKGVSGHHATKKTDDGVGHTVKHQNPKVPAQQQHNFAAMQPPQPAQQTYHQQAAQHDEPTV